MYGIEYIQWYNANEGRHYPLAEAATCVDNDGLLMPDDIIADMGLVVPPAYDDAYLSSLRISTHIVTLSISAGSTGILVGTFGRAAIEPYKAYPLTGLVGDVTGWVVFGNHRGLTTAGTVEDYRMASGTQAALERRALHVVDPIPVTKLLRQGSLATTYATQLVDFLGRRGVVVTRDEVDDQKLWVGLSEAAQRKLVGPCDEAAGEDSCIIPPLRGINGVCPDDDGVITLRFQ